jgi:hypothetical protein
MRVLRHLVDTFPIDGEVNGLARNSSSCVRSIEFAGDRGPLGKEKAGGSSPPVGSQFNSTVSLHLLVDFSSPKNAARKCSSAPVLYPNLVRQAIATGTTFIGVGETVSGGSRSAEVPS